MNSVVWISILQFVPNTSNMINHNRTGISFLATYNIKSIVAVEKSNKVAI